MSGVGQRVIAGLALGTLVAGCMVGPDYSRPEAPEASTWKERKTVSITGSIPTPRLDYSH